MAKIGDAYIDGDYDGKKALVKAKKNAKDIEKALNDQLDGKGGKTGDKWGDEFDNALRKRLNKLSLPALDKLEGQAEKSGSRGGTLFSTSFDKRIKNGIRRTVDGALDDLALFGRDTGFDELSKKVGGAENAMKRFRSSLDLARSAGALNESQIARLNEVVDEQSTKHLSAIENERAHTAELKRLSNQTKNHTDLLQERAKAESSLNKSLDNVARTRAAEQTRVLSLRMSELEKVSRNVNGRLEEQIKKFGDVDRARSSFSKGLADLNRNGDLVTLERSRIMMEEFDRTSSRVASKVLPNMSKSLDDVGRRSSVFTALRAGLLGFERDGKKHVGILGAIAKGWKGLDDDVRIVIALIAAGASQISVLGSALGGTIIALASIGTVAIASIGIAVAGFKGLYSETVTLTEGAQASKDAFSSLGDQLKVLQGSITNAMFDGMESSISNLTTNLIPGISTAIENMSSATGQALGRIFDSLSSDKGVGVFNEIFDAAGPIISSLTDMIIGFGGAFGNILAAAMPLAQSFADSIGSVGMRFLEWSSSEPGRERIAEWLNTAATIMPKVMGLVASMGQALANLVTPQTIAQTGQLLDDLTQFMPALSGILAALSGFNILGIVASLLNAVGQALSPLMPLLQSVGYFLSELVITALDFVGTGLGAVMQQLSPVIEALSGAFTALGDALRTLRETGDVSQFFRTIMEVVAEAIPAIINGVSTMIQNVVTAIASNLPGIIAMWSETFMSMVTTIVEIVPELVANLSTALVVLVQTITAAVPLLLDAALQLFTALIDALVEVAPEVGRMLIDLLPTLADAVLNGVTQLLSAGIELFLALVQAVATAIPQVVAQLAASIPKIAETLTSNISLLLAAGLEMFLSLVQAL
ncbi:MAG: phage tail protein, partial [Brevibacterium aurantiacum]